MISPDQVRDTAARLALDGPLEVPDVGRVEPRELLALAEALTGDHYRDGRRAPDAGDVAADVLSPGWRTLACRITRTECWADACAVLDVIEERAAALATAGEGAA